VTVEVWKIGLPLSSNTADVLIWCDSEIIALFYVVCYGLDRKKSLVVAMQEKRRARKALEMKKSAEDRLVQEQEK